MAAEEEVVILARLAGTRQFLVNSEELSVAMKEMGLASETTGRSFVRTGQRGYLMNQALFTVRRLVYGVTLGFVAAGVAALRMGNDYNTAMQNARVALRPFFSDQMGLNHALDRLWFLAKYTPFQIKDMTVAFARMYPSFHALGIGSDQVVDAIGAVINGLSVAQQVTPSALNRVSVALTHLAFQGHLTGISVNQLARDGIPIFAILQKELGLTADQMHQVGKLGIPASVAMQAIIHYMNTAPGYAGASMRLATRSFTGLWSTFKDNVSRIMGSVEHGMFDRMQTRLIAFNNFFNRVQSNLSHGGGATTFMRTLSDTLTPNGEIMRFWSQFLGVWHAFWATFGGVIHDLTHSQSLWLAVYGALVLVRGILVPLNFSVQHFGGLLNILIPLYIAWFTYTRIMIKWLILQELAETALTTRTEELTFSQTLLALATGRYQLIAKLAAAATWVYAAAQAALVAWTERAVIWMTVMAIRGEFLANITLAQLAVSFLRLRIAAATFFTTVDLAIGPVGWVILGITLVVTALAVLYMKWDFFHNLVNRTVMFFRNNWRPILSAAFQAVLGPLVLIIRYFNHILHLGSRIVGFFHGIGGFLGHAVHIIPGVVPGAAEGGTVLRAGLTMVGERGAELVHLPVGASITPNREVTSAFSRPEGWMNRGHTRPVIVQLVMEKRVLAQAMVDIESDQMARA